LAAGDDVAGDALAWAAPLLDQGPVLIAASAEPAAVKAAQDQIGRARAGELIETCMARVAEGLVAGGVRRLVVAGGETSGAVVAALGISGLHIGGQIAAGVPATVTIGDRPLALALKSGNFGGPDFFVEALAAMP
ncbi:MAG: nucleotide-binding domain containing protein, partial [Pseudomonadota bacterium]|nr:nucleotide-binding domain containing protein [Pseudomonadota bacterium]